MILFSGLANAERVFFMLKGGYFIPSEQAFREIYGSGMMFGGELAFKIWKSLDIWLDGNYLKRTGKQTYTQEKTELRIIPVAFGLRYRFISGITNLYLGLGACYFIFHESNVIGDVDKGGIGFKGKMGSFFSITRNLFFDLSVSYSYGKMNPADFTINVGGIEAAAGIGFKF